MKLPRTDTDSINFLTYLSIHHTHYYKFDATQTSLLLLLTSTKNMVLNLPAARLVRRNTCDTTLDNGSTDRKNLFGFRASRLLRRRD